MQILPRLPMLGVMALRIEGRLVGKTLDWNERMTTYYNEKQGTNASKAPDQFAELWFAFARAMLLLLPLLIVTPRAARAYIDPGSGAFVYQTLYAACLGGFFYLRRLLDRVWRRRKSPARLPYGSTRE
ncbi:MAG: hypothetical protein ABI165_16025 [Bryobacteraceae bacterium]